MNDIKIGSTIRGLPLIKIGMGIFPVIFANVGVSSDKGDVNAETKKAESAIAVGADAIADLSLVDGIGEIQKQFVEKIEKPLSAVAVYEVFIKAQKNSGKIAAEKFIAFFEQTALRGIDVITIHATVRKSDIDRIKATNRIIPCTSRGGAMLLELMQSNNYDNPYNEYFDDILKIASKYSVTLSLGPTFRAGSVCDSVLHGELDSLEINRMAELVARAQKENVAVMIEGIGHAPISHISELVQKSITACHNAPYRVLSVATDIALGYDHIASAIASSIAVFNGASSITAVTRSEHIGLPSIDDIVEGVISARIAAYCGYSSRTSDFSRDREMSMVRNKNGCAGLLSTALCPNIAVTETIKQHAVGTKSCDMCGNCCPYMLLEHITNSKNNWV